MKIFSEEFRLVSAGGETHWVRSEAQPRRMENGEILWDGVAIQIDACDPMGSKMAPWMLPDPLTGLLTRAGWHHAVAAQLGSECIETAGWGVLCLDIKGFGPLNGRLGQAAGEDVLREMARRVTEVASSVGGIAARLGGDEFAILIPGCSNELVLSSTSNAAGEAVSLPMQVGGQQVTIQIRTGAALIVNPQVVEDGNSHVANELTKQAELALLVSKKEGGCGHIIYSREVADRFQSQNLLAATLAPAIANEELELHYQPLVDLASGRVVSAEALLRWNHPALGMQRPDSLIQIAEESGLIVQLGRWVFKQALLQHRSWQQAGLRPPPIAINVSGRQLLDPGFVGFVQAALVGSGAAANNFEIELTEGLLIEPSPEVMVALHSFRAMGFTLTIDDFGSGHASFRYLSDFPVDKLKLDQLFVRKLEQESTDALIIRSVIMLARSMGVALVAEGIETEMQRSWLLREGCEIGQGYLFSRPLAAPDFAALLSSDIRLPLRRS